MAGRCGKDGGNEPAQGFKQICAESRLSVNCEGELSFSPSFLCIKTYKIWMKVNYWTFASNLWALEDRGDWGYAIQNSTLDGGERRKLLDLEVGKLQFQVISHLKTCSHLFHSKRPHFPHHHSNYPKNPLKIHHKKLATKNRKFLLSESC